MLSIRLAKTGKRNHPAYRVVVVEKRSGRDGRFLEELGDFDPFHEKIVNKINRERILFWQKRGAKISEASKKILADSYSFKKYSGSAPKSKTVPG